MLNLSAKVQQIFGICKENVKKNAKIYKKTVSRNSGITEYRRNHGGIISRGNGRCNAGIR